ncbi:MAG TPA: ATP-dependent DNA helicase, partial [Rhizomicrobium sp.]
MSSSESFGALPALTPAPGGAVLCENGDCRRIAPDEARALLRDGEVLIAHAAFVSGRLKAPLGKPVYDVLELFAFVRPSQPFVPSALGMARALGMTPPQTVENSARALHEVAALLIDEVAALDEEARARLRPLAGTLARAGWRWGAALLSALGEEAHGSPIAGLEAWRGLPEWEDDNAPGTPGSLPVDTEAARKRLAALVGPSGELRAEQAAYADAAAYAFGPREKSGAPKIALVEAGTGIGKTLGYLAPASLWAEQNGPGLWISTYTRNLQRQIVQEIARLYPDPVERAEKAVVRKGRENYLCLLNFEDAAKRTALAPGQRSVALGLITRWIGAGSDGDVSGAGFPAFLGASMPLSEVTDRRGECIYAACPHYRVCFIERAIRRARHAPIVVANHALVIAQSARDWLSTDQTDDAPPDRPLRYIFDEGHHLFDAADSGFAALLSGREMAEMRRWLRGPEGRARSRMRGLEERLKDLVAESEEAQKALEDAVQAAGVLAGEGWMSRLSAPRGPAEIFLSAAHQHVRARSQDADAFYTLEADTQPLGEEMANAARELARALKRLADPLSRLSHHLRKQMDEKTKELEPYSRARIGAAVRGLDRRAKLILPAWISMLDALETGELRDEFIDWFEIARDDGRDYDVGLERHWIDPTIPLAGEVLAASHGALITSATLRDTGEQDDWASAQIRTGASHLPEPPKRASFGSPFDYARQARIFIVKDVARRDAAALASACRELFLASGGGALGLFTAVRALRAVQQAIA